MACRKGGSVTCVCLMVAELRARRSTTLRGWPVFLPTTCMRLHHVVGVFDGTLSSTPRAISCSTSWRTCSTQCAGMVAGLWIATGSASFFRCILSGGNPVIRGRGWWGHVLKDDAAYCLRNQSLTSFTLSCVIVKGGSFGGGGGGILFRQPHCANSRPSASNCT